MSISGGRDWEDLLKPLLKVSPFYLPMLFMFFVAFVLFFILNVLTAIFVESASQISAVDSDLVIQEDLDSQQRKIRKMRAFFGEEVQEDGELQIITRAEIREHMANEGLLTHLRMEGLDARQVLGLFSLLESRELGGVEREEFVCAIMRLRGAAKGVDIATLTYENRRLNRRLNSLERLIRAEFKRLGAGVAARPAASRSSQPGQRFVQWTFPAEDGVNQTV